MVNISNTGTHKLVSDERCFSGVLTISLLLIPEEISQPMAAATLKIPCIWSLAQPKKTPETWSGREAKELFSAWFIG